MRAFYLLVLSQYFLVSSRCWLSDSLLFWLEFLLVMLVMLASLHRLRHLPGAFFHLALVYAIRVR